MLFTTSRKSKNQMKAYREYVGYNSSLRADGAIAMTSAKHCILYSITHRHTLLPLTPRQTPE